MKILCTRPAERTRKPRPIRCTRPNRCAMDYILGVTIAILFAHVVPQVLIHLIAGSR